MSSEWKQFSLEQIALGGKEGMVDGPFGSNLPERLYTESGIPVIRGSNLTKGKERFRDHEFVYISDETAQKLSRSMCLPGDIVFTKKGTLGQIGFVPLGKHSCYLISSNQMRMRVDPLIADAEFVYYYLAQPKSIEKVIRDSEHTGVPKINLAYLRSFPIWLPPLLYQRRITTILRAIDDRITLLRETNATLEAIAQALFKSWFVDFDPVRAKQQNVGRVSDSVTRQDDCNALDVGLRLSPNPTYEIPTEIAELFPDSFEQSELGLVPRGWRVVPFSETINVIGGGTPKTSICEYWNGDIPWFSVVDAPVITDVFVIDTEKHITQNGLDNSSTKLLPAGTTIISARGTVGRLALTGREMAMNQSCYGLRGKAGDDYFTYFCTYRLVETLRRRTHGSVFDTITRDTLTGVFTVYPEKTVISAFESLLTPTMERIRENLKQTQTLATLRDTLLPRLISGQLRLPDAEAMIDRIPA